MRDVIVYCPDTTALVAELREKLPERLDERLPVDVQKRFNDARQAEVTEALAPLVGQRKQMEADLEAQGEALDEDGKPAKVRLAMQMAQMARNIKDWFHAQEGIVVPPISAKYQQLEAEALAQHKADMTADAYFLIDKTPTKRNGKATLALVRCQDGRRGEPPTEAQLRSLKSITVLGTWEEVRADKKKRAIYDRVYPRKPVRYVDDEGVERTITQSEEIGRFA